MIRFNDFFLKYNNRFLLGFASSGGRNARGHLTAYRKGSGQQKRYRYIDFWRRVNACGFVLRIVYDPFRSSKIALVLYDNGLVGYVLAATGLEQSSIIFSGDSLDIAQKCFLNYNLKNIFEQLFNIGNAYPLFFLPLGSMVNSIELYPMSGSQLMRSAGTSALFYKKSDKYAYLKMPSGWRLLVSLKCMASIGFLSNSKHYWKILGKAGVPRNLGVRPSVRGVAKNAIDHPHGGGRSKGPKPFSPWSKLTKWRSTVPSRIRKKKIWRRFL